MIYFELISVLLSLWFLRKMNILPKVSVIVNWLFCLYVVEITEGVVVSNKKYLIVSEDLFSFLSYFIHIVAFIPLMVLIAINLIQTRFSVVAKIGTMLAGSAILTGEEFLLDAAGVIQHSQVYVHASFAYWYLLLLGMLTFNKIMQWEAQRV